MNAETFNSITAKHFNGIDGYNMYDVSMELCEFIDNTLYGCNVDVVDVVIAGSRSRFLERDDSDLDVIVAFESDEWDEDALFNLLNDEHFTFCGVTVDFNPIEYERLDSYLDYANNYLAAKSLA